MLRGRRMAEDHGVVIGATVMAAVSVPDSELSSVPMLHAGIEILVLGCRVSEQVFLAIHHAPRKYNI